MMPQSRLNMDEFVLISYAVVGYIILVILAFLFNLQLAVRIITDGVFGIAGFIIFTMSIADLADRRGLRTVDIIVYALLVILYAVLAGTVVAYWEPWVKLYALIGSAGVLGVGCTASELLSRLPN